MQKSILAVGIAILAGCASPGHKRETYDLINAEMSKAAQANANAQAQPAQPDAVSQALLPPLQIELPKPAKPLETRFSITVNNVPAAKFFNSLVSDTPYNMLVHPDVTGTVSANLKDVTLFEALDAIRELYGYDYRVEGSRIIIKPLTIQTKVFQVNYLMGSRRGTSDTRVSSGSVSDVRPAAYVPGAPGVSPTIPQNGAGGEAGALESAKVSTSSLADFWGDLKSALEAIVGAGKDGRSIVISPQSGVVVVRAMPDELQNVTAYLKATQLAVDRQVILEAKILEVELNDSYQTGVNWAAFRTQGNTRISTGVISPGSALSTRPPGNALTSTGETAIGAVAGASLAAPANTAGTLFGLALQSSNFAALLSFLETQGTVHVLSSPRIATLNNQKAVLKVGTDEFFVTNVSATTVTGTATTTIPNVTLQPFFSGVVLDVTPQIDDSGNIVLHVHPSVSQVSTVNKPIDLGTLGGLLNLPLASSNTSETDSVVRGQDGQIVAIGGLMRQATTSDRSQVPGAGSVPGLGALFGSTSRVTQKRELVILLKPTIVSGSGNWSQDILDSQQRIQQLDPRAFAR